QQRRLASCAPDCRSQLFYRMHRLAVRLFDDVASLDSCLGRSAIRIDLLDDEAVRVPGCTKFRRELGRQRFYRNAERCLVCAIRLAAEPRRLAGARLVKLDAQMLLTAV